MNQQILATILDELRGQGCNGQAVGADTRLEDLNLDSLGLLSTLAGVEDAYGITMPSVEWTMAETLGEIARKVEVHLDTRSFSDA